MRKTIKLVSLIIILIISIIMLCRSHVTINHQLILDYLRLIFSWPCVVLVIGLIFISKFSDSIKSFLKNIHSLKAGAFEVMQHQEPSSAKGKTTKKSESKNRVRFFEFAYLNLHLVYNSKLSLLWFYRINKSTKENFLALFSLSPQIVNPYTEKEVIFNTLLVNKLLEQEKSLFSVSEKGKQFLRYLGYIK